MLDELQLTKDWMKLQASKYFVASDKLILDGFWADIKPFEDLFF